MHGDVVGLVTLDHVLRLLLAGMHVIPFEYHWGGHHLYDPAPHTPCLRIPLHVITDLIIVCHGPPDNPSRCEIHIENLRLRGILIGG